MSRIPAIAKANGTEVVILGAFGCGAFQNSPDVVARAMKEIIKKYLYSFETIEFAVYCPPGDTKNYDVFERILWGDFLEERVDYSRRYYLNENIFLVTEHTPTVFIRDWGKTSAIIRK